MRGHARERTPGRWELRVYVGRDPYTRRKRYVTKTVSATGRGDAETQLADFVTKTAGRPPTEGTFGELVTRWFDIASTGWEPSTIVHTERIVNAHLGPLWDVRLDRLRTIQIDELYALLRTQGGVDGRPLSPASVRRVHSIVHRALEQAIAWEWIGVNPAARAHPGHIERAEISPPSTADVVRLIDEAAEIDATFGLFLRLAAITGARRGELCALRWTDLDGRTVKVARAISIGAEGAVERRKRTRNKGGPRVVAIDDTTLALLDAQRARQLTIADTAGAPITPNAFIFSSSSDGTAPWHPSFVTHKFVKIRRKLDLDTVRLHDLRHFVATVLLEAGVGVPVVAGRLGHGGGGTTTVAIYGHRRPVGDEAAADLLADLLRG